MKDDPITLVVLFGAVLLMLHHENEAKALAEVNRRTLPLVIEGMERRGIQTPNSLKQCANQYEAENLTQGFYEMWQVMMLKIRRGEEILAARGVIPGSCP